MKEKSSGSKKISAIKSVPILQLKITINNTEPQVWRRILVREDMNLGLLHVVIQLATGWTNSHLHQYFIAGKQYSDPEFGIGAEFEGDVPTLDENTLTLADITSGGMKSFQYEYDFGDSWHHTVEIERTEPDGAGFQGYAMCIAGSRACPPEDCGSTHGFANLLEVIKNPGNEEYESMMEWLGGKYDPELCDVGKTNRYLQKIKRPHVSVDELAELLKKRDGYRET